MLQTWLSNTEVEGNWLMKTTKPLKKARVTMVPARKIDKRTTLNPKEVFLRKNSAVTDSSLHQFTPSKNGAGTISGECGPAAI